MSSSEKSLLLPSPPAKRNFVLVIHGGAGILDKSKSNPETEKLYHSALRQALLKGYKVLNEGGEAMDAVVEAVSVLEDNELFNAGKGAVFNRDGKNELEVSIMLSKSPASHPEVGKERRGVGITLLTRTKNPSKLVRLLYLHPERVPHTFISGPTAEEIGVDINPNEIELVGPEYFWTRKRWEEHKRGLSSGPQGTVGAVALDERGCIASLTSTGGMTNKLPGRIGDTPVMGSGFWAEEWETSIPHTRKWWNLKWWGKEKTRKKKVGVGISATGNGDYFIRNSTASTISNRLKFLPPNPNHHSKSKSKNAIQNASETEIQILKKAGGFGGVIALDLDGNVAMPNSDGMYRGVVREDGRPWTGIYVDDFVD